MKALNLIVLACILSYMMGCAEIPTETNTPNPDPFFTKRMHAPVSKEHVDQRSLDEQALDIGTRLEWFAGVFVVDNELVFRSTAVQSVESMISQFRQLGVRKDYSLMNTLHELLDEYEVVVAPAKYSFRDLYEWKEQVRVAVPLHSQGIAGFGIDQKANVIVMDVHEFTDSSEIRKYVSELGIPIDALQFRSSVGARPFPYIYDSIDPAVGGIGIQAFSSPDQCTLGFNAAANFDTSTWRRIFFTADHCTRAFGNVGERFFQPERLLT